MRWGEGAGIHLRGAVLLACCALLACAPGRAQLKAPPGFRVKGAAVYPFAFRWEEPPYRSFELAQRLIDVGLQEAGGRVAFFGPSEFKVLKADADAAWVGSTALPLMAQAGVPAEQAVVLRAWAEKRVNSSTQAVQDAKGRAAGTGATEATTYVGHVEVLHPSSGQQVLELQAEVTTDPFQAAERAASEELDFDPAPELTALMEGLVRDAVRALAKAAPPRDAPKDLGWTLALTPAEALRYEAQGERAARLELATKDAAEGAVFLQSRALFANPRLPGPLAAKLTGLAPGLYVVAAPPGALVEPGDLILGVDGQTALPHVLARARLSGTPPQLKIRRARGGEEDVYLP